VIKEASKHHPKSLSKGEGLRVMLPTFGL